MRAVRQHLPGGRHRRPAHAAGRPGLADRRRPSPPARTAPTAAAWCCTATRTRWSGSPPRSSKGLNNGNLCVKGRFGMGYADSPDRLDHAPGAKRQGRAAGGLVGRGARAGQGQDRRRSEGQGRQGRRPRSAARTPPTRRPTCCRSSCARWSAPTTWTPSTTRSRSPPRRRWARPSVCAAATNSRKDLAQADVILVVGREPHRVRSGAGAGGHQGAASGQDGHSHRSAHDRAWPARRAITWR